MRVKNFFMLLGAALLCVASFGQTVPSWQPGTATTTNYHLYNTSSNLCLGLPTSTANTSYKLLGVGSCKFQSNTSGGGYAALIPGETSGVPSSLELGTGGTNNFTSQIDFKGSAHLGQDFWGRLRYTDGTGFGFQTANVTTDRMVITESGLIGIGITPAANIQLHVEGLATKFSSGTSYIGFAHGAANIDLAGSSPQIDFKGTSHLANDFWGRLSYVDGTGFDFYTGGTGTPKIRLKEDGKLILGDPSVVQTVTPTTLNDYKLFVDGGIIAEKVKVALCCGVDWADYVFAPDYQLLSLDSVETYISTNQHLPGVPSSEEVQENGIEVAAMDALLLQKIEELTLYMIELKKQNEVLKNELEELKK